MPIFYDRTDLAIVLEITGKRIIEAAEKAARGKGVEHIQSTLLFGDPAQKIIESAKVNGIDLIVMGSRGLGETGGGVTGKCLQKGMPSG